MHLMVDFVAFALALWLLSICVGLIERVVQVHCLSRGCAKQWLFLRVGEGGMLVAMSLATRGEQYVRIARVVPLCCA